MKSDLSNEFRVSSFKLQVPSFEFQGVTAMLTAQEIIEKLQLEAHPTEGGFYRQTYRSAEMLPRRLPGDKYSSERALGTAIYYLLTPETFSRIHRLKSDEIFHFYLGDPVFMLLLYPEGRSQEITLGTDILNGQRVQVIVPRNTWQGSVLQNGGRYALLGTTMSPGFDYADYENGSRAELWELYPDKKDWINRLAVL
jgi:predicted cupin superfamily sugar epimerase